MNPLIRPFVDNDGDRLIEILKCNGQFDWPAVEGLEAMRRVAACEAAVFFVAEVDGLPQGLIRAVFDGSRALIHLLSVHPDVAHCGIGRALVRAVHAELRRRGASSLSVTVTDTSAGFWRKQGFEVLPVYVMLKRSLQGDPV